jgi:hypothetical protein
MSTNPDKPYIPIPDPPEEPIVEPAPEPEEPQPLPPKYEKGPLQ